MPEYLPLCTSRVEMLPASCRACAWWQTAGIARVSPQSAATVRARWLKAVEADWGEPGLVQTGGHALVPETTASLPIVPRAAIHYAPAALMPRLRDLLPAVLPADAVVLFCLRFEGTPDPRQARRLLHEALQRLKSRRVREVYAVSTLEGGAPQEEHCEFFSREFLKANGFEEHLVDHDLFLMRADLRGLLSVLAPIEAALRRLLHQEPTPSPAAWSTRGEP